MREEDLMNEICRRAASYVPEWRVDRSMPDMGVALAEVFARMQSRTENKYEHLREKYQRDFFNCLNTSMKGSAPARGYAVFGLSGGEVGVELPAGTALRTEAYDAYEERIPVETEEELYVIPDTLEAIYECSEQDDYIGLHYEKEQEKTGFSLFVREAENLQEHVFYMGHVPIFSMKGHGSLILTFLGIGKKPLEKELLDAFADPSKAEFFYLTEEGEVPFSRVRAENGDLVLTKTGDMPAWEMTELSGEVSCWLGCRILHKPSFDGLELEEVSVASRCQTVPPELVYADGAERRAGSFYAFGEEPSLYGELYISSGEAFEKRGAVIELSFEQDFVKIPVSQAADRAAVKWKLVMPKEDIPREKEYEITIREVVWEYYNGVGWTSLFPDRRYAGLFNGQGSQYRQVKTISFVCPDDIRPVLVGAVESFWIRARIVKMDHLFKTSGFYLAPMLSGVMLRYEYGSRERRPQLFLVKNNGSARLLQAKQCLGTVVPFCPVKGTGDKGNALYLGFGGSMEQGPVRLLWVMEHDFEMKFPTLIWEYFGSGGWQRINQADETENFSKTGLITLPGLSGARRLRLFERELYWIRVRDEDGGFLNNRSSFPRVQGFWLNAVRVITVRSGLTERLTMESYRSRTSFRLLNRNIHQLEVWVQENRIHGEEELNRLKKEGRLWQTADSDGIIRETWIRWSRTDNFLYHNPADRCYMLDANEGILTFGGGTHGAIPAPGVPDGIRVNYSVGGGACCNLLPGQISGLELSAGFVNMATNPLALSGGYDRETAGEAMDRAGRERKHQFRAVAGEDYISLVREATRNIEKVRCFSGMDAGAERSSGAVTLVILRKDYEAGGRFFEEMKEEIRRYLRDKLPAAMWGSQKLFIREPVLVEIELSITASSKNPQDMFGLRRRINEAVRRFLNPVHGNFDGTGWEIGTLPDRLQLETVVKTVPGLLGLESLVAFACLPKEPGKPQRELEELGKNPFVLPVSGEHRIHVKGGNAYAAGIEA